MKRNLNGTHMLRLVVADMYDNANSFSFFHYRLEGILSKRNLSPAKLDELKIKFNILKSFVEPASKETISREEAEL